MEFHDDLENNKIVKKWSPWIGNILILAVIIIVVVGVTLSNQDENADGASTQITPDDIELMTSWDGSKVHVLEAEDEEAWIEQVCSLLNSGTTWYAQDMSISEIPVDEIRYFAFLSSGEVEESDLDPSHLYAYADLKNTMDIRFNDGEEKECDFLLFDLSENYIFWGSGDAFLGAMGTRVS